MYSTINYLTICIDQSYSEERLSQKKSMFSYQYMLIGSTISSL